MGLRPTKGDEDAWTTPVESESWGASSTESGMALRATKGDENWRGLRV